MTDIALPAPVVLPKAKIWVPNYEDIGQRLKVPKWARPWEKTKEDVVTEAATVVTAGGGSKLVTTSITSTTFTLSRAPATGNIVLLASSAFNNISTVSGAGVTWSSLATFSGDTNHNDEDIWWGIAGTGTTTVTVNYAASTGFAGIRVIEITSAQKLADATVPFADDAQSTNDTKSIGTANSGCVIVSVIGIHNPTTTATVTVPTGYTLLSGTSSSGNGLWVAYLQQATAGSSTMNWTGFSPGSYPALGAVAITPAGASGLAYGQDKIRRNLQAVVRSSSY